MNYTIKDFQRDFPNNDTCLDFIFNHRYGKDYECPKCQKVGFHRVKGRKCYTCAWCGYQLHPLAGTIFHKSSTKLTDWFFAIFLMSNSKNGVSAKEIERHLGVTYKCAWRIAKQVRSLMKDEIIPLFTGTIEIDETYVGGHKKGKRGRGSENKTVVVGIVERNGGLKAETMADLKSNTILPAISKSVATTAIVYTDELNTYNPLRRIGYKHERINHSDNVYVRGDIHTNTIEGFWSQMKRSINGTYHSVSRKHLQTYVDEFSYRYNHRDSQAPVFHLLLGQLVSWPRIEA